MSFHKIGYLDIQHALSESRSSEKEATHPTRRASFGKLKTENMMCSYNRKQKKNNLKTILITCVVPIRSKENKMKTINRCSSNRKQKK